MVFEVRIVAALGWVGGHMSGAFWGAGKVLFLELGAGNMVHCSKVHRANTYILFHTCFELKFC